jgi:GAF domain-containing protein
MNWQTVASSLVIFCGAAVILFSIIKLGASFKATSFVPVRSRSSIVRFLRFHRLLMVFFLFGYIVVASAYLSGLRFVGELFVSAIFLFGAIFVFLSIMLQSRMFSEIQVTVHNLEDALMGSRALNQELKQQTSRLRATAEITQAGSSILDPEVLSREVVNCIQEGFSFLGVYYVSLFLLDETQEYAVLKAATGDAERLLKMGHKLEVDEATTIGWSIVHQEARIALDLEEGAVQLDIPPMPHTRSEIALPLRSRGRTLGALSVQSTREAAFKEADITVLQATADQVALAIDNARLFTQTEAAHRLYLTEAWQEFLATRPTTRVDYAQPGAKPGDEGLLHDARRAAMLHQRTVATDSPSSDHDEASSSSQTALMVPLKLRGQVIGTIALHETRHQRPWTAGEITLAETIAEQVTQTIENLRLMDETRRRAARERGAREIADRMQRAADMETLMHITAEELNRALGGSRAYVRLGTEASLHQAGRDDHTSEGGN